ncbi:MAG: TerB N-terminal domain-containing protein [Cyanobacteria bacterium P01_G01_bin.54]
MSEPSSSPPKRPRYEKVRELGRHPQNKRVTVLAKDNQTGKPVVIKQFNAASGASSLVADQDRIQALLNLRHPQIPRYLGAYSRQAGFYVVREVSGAKPLSQLPTLKPKQSYQIAIAALTLLQEIHGQAVTLIHGNLHSRNILVDAQLKVYLVDFALAQDQELKPVEDLANLGMALLCNLAQWKFPATDAERDRQIEPIFAQAKSGQYVSSLLWLNWLKKLSQSALLGSQAFASATAALQTLKAVNVLQTTQGVTRSSTAAHAVSPSSSAWIPPGASIEVGGYHLADGMVYVGSKLEGESLYASPDPGLINPQLRVSSQRSHPEAAELDYWPAYHAISPTQRGNYLDWLAQGRRNPTIDSGYLFLFFYGLERRVFRDLFNPDNGQAASLSELKQIIIEVEALYQTYASQTSWLNHAANFLDICRLLVDPNHFAEFQPPLHRTAWQIPLGLKVGLGQRVAAGEPLPADWLLSWYMHSEQARLRTPATRCATEFHTLLRQKYQQQYGAGMVIKPNQTRLKLDYRPASAGFDAPIAIPVGDLPDVTALTAPLTKLQILIDDCTDALDPYSRWLGRNPGSTDARTALALLPAELAQMLEQPEIMSLRQWLTQTLGNRPHVPIAARELLAQWFDYSPTTLTKKEAMTLAQGLANLGYGIEPDVRFGGKTLKASDRLVLFALGAEQMSTPSTAYQQATLTLHLAAAVASADTVAATEQDYLEAHLETTLDLADAERRRLRAHLAWLLQTKPSFRGLKQKLADLTPDAKTEIADLLISVAGADGQVSPQEIKILSKIYPLLGFAAEEIYRHLHQLGSVEMKSAATEPVTVRAGSGLTEGYAIPAPPPEPTKQSVSSSFTLDLEAIAQKQTESAQVANLLGDIFAEDEADSPSAAMAQPELKTVETVAGLDGPHSQFLQAIAGQTHWPREVAETLAEGLGLMLDGALEVLNDAAFEQCDEALTDGDDPIELDPDVLEQLLR